MPVTLLHDPACLRHDPGPTHPEAPARVAAVLAAARGRAGIDVREVRVRATADQLAWVHSREQIAAVLRTRGAGGQLDAETPLSAGSADAATHAAGLAIAAVDLALESPGSPVFALTRPPGHHAHRDHGGGYCVFNNAALAAERARRCGLARVLILDWDVHHGDGTQAVFWTRPDVFYASLHARDLFPSGSGSERERGEGLGLGATLNVPLDPGAGDADWLKAAEEIVAPAALRFAPELVIVSAGFDGHRDDPLSTMDLTESGYAGLASVAARIARASANSRLVLLLEGGYGFPSLQRSVVACLDALAAAA